MTPDELTRRRFIESSAVLSAAVVLGSCGDEEEGAAEPGRATGAGSEAEARTAVPTPACDDGDDPTPQQTEGPYYTPDTPRKTNLVTPSVKGRRLLLTGRVLDTNCKPIRRALLDFWQADGEGQYDNQGYRLRGHQFTDARGRFRLRTVVPGLYPGRTRHIHVKVQRPRGRVLTTQLYFPGEAGNSSDGIFDRELLMAVGRRNGRRVARFDFVLR